MAAGDLTLLQLKTLARQEADQVNSLFVSDAELTSYINQSYFELYDLMVQKYGDDYFVGLPYVFTPNGTDDRYALPADFYKAIGVDLNLGNAGDSWITIHRFNMSDRNRFAVPNFQNFYGVTNLRYRLSGDTIWLTPTPTSGQQMRIWYVPRMVELVADGDVAKGVSGWLEYVVVDAAMKMMAKEESDVSVLMARKQMLIQRIESAAENRDAGQPMVVADNSTGSGYYPDGFTSGRY